MFETYNLLEMSLEDYLKIRWDKLSMETKKKLGLNDRENYGYIMLLWKFQYYRDKCEQMEKKLNEV